MDRHSIDYKELNNSVNKRKVYRYADVKDRLVKVAWDIVKWEDPEEGIDGLWRIQTTDDGEVIVATYDAGLTSESQQESTKVANASDESESWDVVPGRDDSMNIFYRGEAVRKIAASEVGVDSSDIKSFCKNVESKLNTDSSFKNVLLRDIPEQKRQDLLRKYPELTK